MKRIIIASLILVSLLIACIAPTAAYAQELTPEEQAYMAIIADHSSRVGEAMGEISELMANPQIGNDEWTIDMAVQLVTIQMLYDEAMEIDPPASMANIHYKYVQAMSHYENSTHLITQGIDELDAGLINQATTEISAGTQLVHETTELLEEFTESRLTGGTTPPQSPSAPPSANGGGCGCFIATAAYGTDTAPEIDILRDFRDEILLQNSLGTQFVSFYYKTSPPIADFISQNAVLRAIVREGFVDPIVAVLDLSKNLWAE